MCKLSNKIDWFVAWLHCLCVWMTIIIRSSFVVICRISNQRKKKNPSFTFDGKLSMLVRIHDKSHKNDKYKTNGNN